MKVDLFGLWCYFSTFLVMISKGGPKQLFSVLLTHSLLEILPKNAF